MTDEEHRRMCADLRAAGSLIGDGAAQKALNDAADEIERLAALAQSDAEPREIDPTQVICPNCTHQFRAISVTDQERLRAQSNAEPVAWPDIDAAVKAGLAMRNPAPDAAPSAHSNVKTVTIGGTAPPRPDASAGLIEAAEIAEQCANGSFSKNEAMYLRGFADRLRARAADRSGK